MRKSAGYLLIALAVLALLLALFNVVDAIASRPASEGYQALTLFNLFVGTPGCILSAYLLYRWSRSLLHPERFSSAALAAARLREIYEAERLATRTFSSVRDDVGYASRSDKELDDIYRFIDRRQVPDRFTALLAAIKLRIETPPSPPTAPAPPKQSAETHPGAERAGSSV